MKHFSVFALVVGLSFICIGCGIAGQPPASVSRPPVASQAASASVLEGHASSKNALPAASPEAFESNTLQTITFPVSDEGKEDYNAFQYNIPLFDCSFQLPEGWTLQLADPPVIGNITPHYLFYMLYSTMDILNAEGDCVGSVGYRVYEPSEGGDDLPREIYCDIGLGNGYKFAVHDETYQEIETQQKHCVTAITKVQYSEAFLSAYIKDAQAKENPGILSYNKSLAVYIAMEFSAEKVTEAQLQAIAQSIDLLPAQQ